jgi:hypothetical protein
MALTSFGRKVMEGHTLWRDRETKGDNFSGKWIDIRLIREKLGLIPNPTLSNHGENPVDPMHSDLQGGSCEISQDWFGMRPWWSPSLRTSRSKYRRMRCYGAPAWHTQQRTSIEVNSDLTGQTLPLAPK